MLKKSRDLRRAGPIAAARVPGGGREGRNAAAFASTFQSARFQPDVVLSKIPVDTTAAPAAVAGILARLAALEAAHNGLLAAQRDVRLLEDAP